jgi:DNA-binding CsgD family transcriptional regulator
MRPDIDACLDRRRIRHYLLASYDNRRTVQESMVLSMPGGAKKLLGREAELATLAEVTAPAHDTVVVCLVGDAGIGKSTLLDEALSRRTGQGEVTLLVRGSAALQHERLGALRAMETALLAGTNGRPDDADCEGFATALVDRLKVATERRNVVVCVDELHMIDEGSVVVMQHLMSGVIGRQLPLTIIVCARPTDDVSWAGARFREISVGMLPSHYAAALVGHENVSDRVASHCHAALGGNTLALVELRSSLTAAQLSGSEAAPDPLPLGRQSQRRLEPSLHALPGATRQALCVAAAEEHGNLAAIELALTHLGLETAALDDAEDRGLIHTESGRITWPDPLVRSVAYYSAPRADRRKAHRALAVALRSFGGALATHAPEHAGRAAVGVDESTSSELQAAAADLVRVRRVGHAAQYFEAAARLATNTSGRANLLADAGDAFRRVGNLGAANRVLTQALDLLDDPTKRTRLVLAVAETQAWCVGTVAARNLCDEHNGVLASLERSAECTSSSSHATDRVRLLIETAFASMLAGDPGAMRNACRLALDIAPSDLDDITKVRLEVMHGFALAQCSDTSEAGPAALDSARPQLGTLLAEAPHTVADAACVAAFADIINEEFDRAEAMLRRVIESGAVDGFSHPLAVPLLAELLWRVGRWNECRTLLEDSSRSPQSQRCDSVGDALANAVMAKVLCISGDAMAASDYADSALDAGTRFGSGLVRTAALHARGLAALAAGDTETACVELRATMSELRASGIVGAGWAWVAGDLIEALLDAGRVAEAEVELDTLTMRASVSGSVWAEAVAGRLRGRLVGGARGAKYARESAREFSTLPAPFEHARSLEVSGDRTAALAMFDSLGAQAFAASLRSKMDRSGDHVVRLTSAERRVAEAAVAGGSIKSVAAGLRLAPKTVEFYLGNIYRKLGVRGRPELVAHWRMLRNDVYASA